MFISVDLPAPFAPRSACTSPLRRSKSTASFASTPGKRFVMPRSSRTGGESATLGAILGRYAEGGPVSPPSGRSVRRLAELCRGLDLARDDLRPEAVDLLDELGRDVRVDLTDANAVVLEVEHEVRAALELAVLGALDGEVDARVHVLDGARQDVRRMQVRLVDVDADPPDAGLVGRVERAEAARAGDVELDLRARVDLVLRDRLALRLVDEVLRVADQDLDAGIALRRARLVAGEERVDRRDLDAADDADRLRAALLLDHQAREAAHEVGVLLRRVRQALDVLDAGLRERVARIGLRR